MRMALLQNYLASNVPAMGFLGYANVYVYHARNVGMFGLTSLDSAWVLLRRFTVRGSCRMGSL